MAPDNVPLSCRLRCEVLKEWSNSAPVTARWGYTDQQTLWDWEERHFCYFSCSPALTSQYSQDHRTRRSGIKSSQIDPVTLWRKQLLSFGQSQVHFCWKLKVELGWNWTALKPLLDHFLAWRTSYIVREFQVKLYFKITAI